LAVPDGSDPKKLNRYEPFNIKTGHWTQFTEESLRWILNKNGFDIKIIKTVEYEKDYHEIIALARK
jgi:hypothetical protein